MAAEGDAWQPRAWRPGAVALPPEAGSSATVEASWLPTAAGAPPAHSARRPPLPPLPPTSHRMDDAGTAGRRSTPFAAEPLWQRKLMHHPPCSQLGFGPRSEEIDWNG